MGELKDEILLLLREMYRRNKNVLHFGLIDVTRAVKEDHAEFVVFAANTKYLMTPLNFFSHITHIATRHSIPYVYILQKEELQQAFCVKFEINVVSVKKNLRQFSKRVERVKSILQSMQ